MALLIGCLPSMPSQLQAQTRSAHHSSFTSGLSLWPSRLEFEPYRSLDVGRESSCRLLPYSPASFAHPLPPSLTTYFTCQTCIGFCNLGLWPHACHQQSGHKIGITRHLRDPRGCGCGHCRCRQRCPSPAARSPVLIESQRTPTPLRAGIWQLAPRRRHETKANVRLSRRRPHLRMSVRTISTPNMHKERTPPTSRASFSVYFPLSKGPADLILRIPNSHQEYWTELIVITSRSQSPPIQIL